MMRFQATWAGVLTVVMLLFSPAASICEAQCSLGRLRPACHSEGAGTRSPEADMVSGMCHGRARSERGAAQSLAVLWSSPCCHRVCVPQPATLTPQRSVTVPDPLLSELVHANVKHLAPEPFVTGITLRWLPSFRPPSTVDLHTIQRV
jgi:hypothetical protein